MCLNEVTYVHFWKAFLPSSEYQNAPSMFCLVSSFILAVSLSGTTSQTTLRQNY